MSSFAGELKRRNVFKVAVAYVVVGWVVMQVADTIAPVMNLPETLSRYLLFFIIIGFPITIFFSWVYEMTPEGLKKQKDIDRDTSITVDTGRKIDFIIIGFMALAIGGLVWDRGNPPLVEVSGEAEVEKSIVVIPFVNMSSDEEQEYFSDGLTEEILNSLARTSDLMVMSRTTSFTYKGSNLKAREIARELDVAHVLEGSVRRGGDQIRVTAQLIRADDGFHLWSETFDGDMENIIQVQERFAFEIAKAMKTVMDPEALKAMVATGTGSVPAFEAFLEAIALERRALASGENELYKKSYEKLEEARALDPTFATAHARSAQFWGVQRIPTLQGSGIYNYSDEEIKSLLGERIDAAIAHAPNEVELLGYKALKAFHDLSINEAIGYYSEFLKHRKTDFWALFNALDLLISSNRIEEAKNLLLEFEPISYKQKLYYLHVQNWLWIGDLVNTKRYVDQVFNFENIDIQSFYQIHRALLWLGDYERASALEQRLLASELTYSSKIYIRLRSACKTNDIAKAKEIYDEYLKSIKGNNQNHWIASTLMGEDDPSDGYFERLEESGNLFALYGFASYPFFDATKYPKLMRIFDREGLNPREVIQNPLACQPPLIEKASQ